MKHFLLILSTAVLLQGKTVEHLMKLDSEFCDAFQKRGLEGWMSYFADDAVAFPNTPGILTKKEDIRRHYEQTVGRPGGELKWKPVGGMISASGDLGFTYGLWESKGRTGKYTSIWKKQKDGSWKIVLDTGVPDQK